MTLLLLILVVVVLAIASFGGAFMVWATVLTDLLAPVVGHGAERNVAFGRTRLHRPALGRYGKRTSDAEWITCLLVAACCISHIRPAAFAQPP